VDRSKVQLTTGEPVPADGSHTRLRPDGQQEGYVVLAPEERYKGFIRPVRRVYRHVGIRPKYPTRPLTPEERVVYAAEHYVEFEEYPVSELPRTGRFWTIEQLNSGCGTTTRMSNYLAETYARDPKFYTGTFCARCAKHFPVEQFVWDGTDERVGS